MKTQVTKKIGRPITHGYRQRSLNRPKEYNSWQHMKQRCYNRRHVKYRWYGQRGITVCPQWIESFEQFLRDVGFAPSFIHTLDRIDNNGHYEPGNVKWSTPSEQMQNTRRAAKYKTAA
jgi:hypothetical protein